MADPKPGKIARCRAKQCVADYYFPTFGLYTLNAGIVVLLIFLATLVTATKAGLLQTAELQKGWTLVVNRPIAFTLIGYYAIQVATLIVVTIRLWSRQTGLRSDWDPKSLADTIAMFQHFNVDVHNLPIRTFRLFRMWNAHDSRLGYWNRSRSDMPGDASVVYGILAHEDGTGKGISVEVQRRLDSHHQSDNVESTDSPYRALPILSFGGWEKIVIWFLGCALAALLIIVASARWTLHVFTILPGGHFQLANPTVMFSNISSTNETEPNFWTMVAHGEITISRLSVWTVVLRIVPLMVANAVIGMAFSFSLFHLYAQPLVDMYDGPGSAENTILLDYLTASSPDVILQAWAHSHWKVLYFSLLNLLGPYAQLLPIGILSLHARNQVVYGKFSNGLLACSLVVLLVYLGSYLLGFLSAKRQFPRAGTSLIDIWLMYHSSHLARSPEFGECGPGWTKADLVATLQLRHDTYMLGVCKGVDGVQRVGFDVAEAGRQKVQTDAALFVDPKDTTNRGHCRLCLDDKDFHEKRAGAAEVKREQYYDRYIEPIADMYGLATRRDEYEHESMA